MENKIYWANPDFHKKFTDNKVSIKKWKKANKSIKVLIWNDNA